MIHLVFTATTPRPASVKEFEFVGYLLGRYVSYAVLPDFSVTAGLGLYSYFSLAPDADLETPLTIRDVYTLSVC